MRLSRLRVYTLTLLCGLLASMATIAPPAAAQDSGEGPLGVIAFSGYDALMRDIDFVGSMGNVPSLSQQVEQMLAMFTQGQGLVGLDKSSPIGVIVGLSASQSPTFTVCLPVSNLKDLVGALAPFDIKADDQGDGTWQVQSGRGGGDPMFAKEVNGWAYFAPAPDMLQDVPENPGEVLGELTKQYDLAAKLNAQNVPEPHKQVALEWLRNTANQQMNQTPDESDEDYAQRKKLTENELAEFEKMVRQLDEVTLGLSLDNDQQRAFFDFIYTATAGTDLSKQMDAYKNVTTDFAGFLRPESAMMFSTALNVEEGQKEQIRASFEMNRLKVQKSIEDEADLPTEEAKQLLKSATNDILSALEETMLAGKIDMGGIVEVGANKATFVTGGLITDPAKIESALKKIESLAKEDEELPRVNWNSGSHQDVQFHSINVPIPDNDEELQSLFGSEVPIVVGIGKQSVYVAGGTDPVEALKSVIDQSAASRQKTVAPMEMSMSLTQIFEMIKTAAPDEQSAMFQVVSDVLASEANGRDHVRMLATVVPNGIRMRMEAEEGVLRTIGLLMMAGQQQQQRQPAFQ